MVDLQSAKAVSDKAVSDKAVSDKAVSDKTAAGKARSGKVANATLRQGRVKWYSLAKGYGFLALKDDGKDVFFHHSEIVGEDDFLAEGALVSFEIVDGPRGAQARQVTVLGE